MYHGAGIHAYSTAKKKDIHTSENYKAVQIHEIIYIKEKIEHYSTGWGVQMLKLRIFLSNIKT